MAKGKSGSRVTGPHRRGTSVPERSRRRAERSQKSPPASDDGTRLQPQELEERLRFETLLADLSARFVGTPAEAVDREIEGAQQKICEALGLHRSSLMMFLKPSGDPAITHSWAGRGFERSPLVPLKDLFPWAVQELRSGRTIRFTSVEELPREAVVDRETFRSLGTKSNLTVPLRVGGRVLGAVAFGTMRDERAWPEALVSRLRLLAEIFASALDRKQADEELTRALLEVERLKDKLRDENVSLREELRSFQRPTQILGRSAAIRDVLESVEQVASAPSAVLITGETGTGKELVARAIHEASPRRDRAMITVNCGSLPDGLIESELFGREKGAYTGALTRQAGRFELAHKSTLFLDEVGDLPPGLQSKLLRVLEDGKFERLGSTRTIEVDVRILAATNKDLEAEMERGRFRRDLFYRLNVFRIHLPPLRERPEDIPVLLEAAVSEFAARMGKDVDAIPPRTMVELSRYPWPGNVRELRNIIEHAMILCRGGKLEIRSPSKNPLVREDGGTAAQAQRAHFLAVLEKTNWRIKGAGGAAEILNLKPSTLYSTLKRLGLANRRDRDAGPS